MQKIKSDNFIKEQGILVQLSKEVIQFFDSRIEIQQLYCKQLLKFNNKFPNIQNQSVSCRKILQHLKVIHLQKYYQIKQFIVQLKQNKINYINMVQKKTQKLNNAVKQIKINQINLSNILQKISKIYQQGQSIIQNNDQQFLLKQLQLISFCFKNKKIQQSVQMLDQQVQLCDNLKIEYENLKKEAQKITKKLKKNQKILIQTSPQIQNDIVQLIKKFTIQQISLIRGMQYDIDNMIKKTNIFDDVPKIIVKCPKNPILFQAKQILKQQFVINDIFAKVKRDIAGSSQQTLKSIKDKNNREDKQQNKKYQTILQSWKSQKNVNGIIKNLSQNYNVYKQPTFAFFGYFRKNNIYKFPKKQFNELLKLFTILLSKSYQQKNLYTMQQLIIYGNGYLDQTQNKSMMQQIKKDEYFSDIYFWRFLLFYGVWKSVLDCLGIEDEKQIYYKNYVYSILVSNSINLLNCGIDKYVAKNNLAKIGKACQLNDHQISDLLKFITMYDHQCKK